MTLVVVISLMLAATAEARVGRVAVQERLRKSETVLAFFDRHAWLTAPRARACWEVPWARSCRVARALVRDHSWQRKRWRRWLYVHLPVPDDWRTAATVVQRVSPGTLGWLMSCSAAEGGHGRFVVYGGGPYFVGAETTRRPSGRGWLVGNWLQYEWPTFKGHYRRALEDARARGFVVDLPAVHDPLAWRTPLAVALAGGWAIRNGQRKHWFASIGRGC